MLRNFRHLCTIAVVFCIAIGLFAYGRFRDRSPSVDVDIVGPSTASVGGMVALVVEGTGIDSYAWIVIPGSCEYRAVEGGKVLISVFHSPGEYTAVLGVNNNSRVKLKKHTILVDPGPTPPPPPPPPVPPEPDPPEPEPDDSAWIKWTYEIAIATVASPGRASQATKLAEQFRSISAQIASGSVKTTKEARVKLRVANNLALGNDALAWAAFSKKFSEHCIELEATGGLKSLAQYQKIYNSAAKGLTKVASKKKKNPRALTCQGGRCE